MKITDGLINGTIAFGFFNPSPVNNMGLSDRAVAA